MTGSEVNDNTIEHKGSHYQILGTFTTNDNPALHAKVTNGYDGSQRTHIDSDISTTIKEVQFGRIAVSEGKQNSLNDIVGTTPWGENTPLRLGVSLGGGNIDTNGLSVSVMPISGDLNDAGRLYILVPGANGRHRPMALGAKSVAEMKEAHSDMYRTKSPFFIEFHKAVAKVAESLKHTDEATRSREFNKSIGYLMNFVNIGKESDIGVHLNERTAHIQIVFKNKKTGAVDEQYIPKDAPLISQFDINTEEGLEFFQSVFIRNLGNVGTYFQINKNNINGNWSITGESYNEALKKSGKIGRASCRERV